MGSPDLSEPLNGNWYLHCPLLSIRINIDTVLREVHKDAFALPQPSRTIRAWERAPVLAHAPRLQGQKIWKRTGTKSQREQDKENFDAAQLELQREGRGTRKRLRLRAKENSGEATWKEDKGEKSGTHSSILNNAVTGMLDPAEIIASPLKDANTNALQFVPRKRTNANHVITPRKPLRQTTLNGQAQTQVLTGSPRTSPEKPRRKKSMRKSVRNSISQPNIPAEAVQGKSKTEVPVREVAKLDTPGEDASLPSQSEDPDKEIGQGEAESFGEHASLIFQPQSEAEKEAAEGLLNEKLNILFDLTDAERSTNEEPVQTSKDSANESMDAIERSSEVIKLPLNDLQEYADEKPSQIRVHDNSEEKSDQTPETDENQPSRGRQPAEMASMIFESIETGMVSNVVHTSKTTSTPKKKRGASQRRGSRRSTRTTRASSVPAEEQTAPGESAPAPPSSAPPDGAADYKFIPVGQIIENHVQFTAIEPAEQVENTHINQVAELAAVQGSEFGVAKLERSIEITLPQDPNIVTVSDDLQGLGGSARSDDVDLEDFDISAQITLQLSAESQQPQITSEDFELPSAAASTIPESLLDEETKPGMSVPEGRDSNSPGIASSEDSSPVRFSPTGEPSPRLALKNEEPTVEFLETLKPISITAESENLIIEGDTMSPTDEDLPESSTPDPTTSKLVETISENTQPVAYDHDDTDMLRTFVTRVKANKAAKAGTQIPRRKRSLPHSPLRLPLGEAANDSPVPPKMKDDFDVGLPGPSPSKRQKFDDSVLADEDDTITERKPTRRSGRTRLPVVKPTLGAPSHIPLRRLGQDGDTTVTLKRTEEKELAALTRVNTRKNKGGAQSVSEFLAKKAEEKEDPALRQRFLKEVFDERAKKEKKERRKTVVWAEELTQYQTVEGRKVDEKDKEKEKVPPAEEKKSAVKVGIRSKIALGMAVNGTPAPKRKRTR